MAIPPVASVTAISVVAIAALLISLLSYLSRLLATRLRGITQQRPILPSMQQQQQARQKLIADIQREVSAQSPRSHLWNGELRVDQKTAKLTTIQHMTKAFRHPQIEGSLLVLGSAGAGKTTLLMELGNQLIEHSENQSQSEQPIPVLLNLNTWSDRYLSFEQWFLIELHTKYGLRFDLGEQWLETQQFVLLLDGLDEVDPALQSHCIEAINQFQQNFLPPGLVVCSQWLDYQQHPVYLQAKGILLLQPLTAPQIQKHLETLEQPHLWQTLRQNPQMLRLAQSPILLHLLTQTRSPSAVATTPDLLKLHLETKLGRDNPHSPSPRSLVPQPSQALVWLRWLARRLRQQGQNEFLIEQMQPSWLPNIGQRVLHRVWVVLLAAGLVGAIAAATDLISDLGISSPVFWGIIAGAIAAFPDRIRLVETLAWSRQQARKGLIIGMLRGIIGCIILGIFLVALCAALFLVDPIFLKSIRETLTTGGVLGLTIILLSGLMGALLTGLLGPAIERKTLPNQGIWRSARNTLVFALLGFVFGSLLTGLCSGVLNLFLDIISPIVPVPLALRILYYPPVMLKTGLMIGVISGLTAGLACLQHFVLRVMLWCNGSIPWNYARFLNDVTGRSLLQQWGGRYRFSHRLLQDYLAQSSPVVSSVSSPSVVSEVSAVGSKTTL
jgi:hypothetical protein